MSHRPFSFRLAGMLVAVLGAVIWSTPAPASDAPHDGVSSGVECISCHQGHNGAGMSLSNQRGNSNLCLSCHQIAQANLPAFVEADMADLNARRGFHHRWDSGVAGYTRRTVTANGSTGEMISAGDYTGAGEKSYVVTLTGNGSASTAAFSWTGTGGAGGTGAGTCGTGVALNEGVTLTCRDEPDATLGTCGQFFCAGDVFTVYATDKASNPTATALTLRLPDGKVTCSTCHDQHSQAQASYTSRTVGGNPWKHFMRIGNGAAQLCKECHADRFPNAADPNFPLDHTRSHTGAARSHPVSVGLDANGKGYDRAEPLDANGALQSVGDGVASNDLLLGPSSEVTCLTCHGVHSGAADGNSQTD